MKKTNKTFKRFAAITSASLLAACAMAPVAFNAYAQTVKISLGAGEFNGESIERTFKYVQILSGESETTEPGIVLNNPAWNTDNIDVAKLITALANDTTFGEGTDNPFKDAGGNALTTMSATVFADKIKNFGEDSDKSQALAKAIYNSLNAGVGTTQSGNQIDINEDGYYLITDETVTSNKYNSNGRYILTTIDGDSTQPISAKLKASAPSVIKKVQEDDKAVTSITNPTTLENSVATSDKWNDVADYCIGEAVPFQLYGSMPSTLGDYNAYFYQFNDTLGAQFNQPEKVTVKLEAETIVFTLSEVEKEVGGSLTMVKEYTTPTDKNCRVKYEDHKLTVTFEDVTAYENVDNETVVTVYYEAVLNDQANIGIPGQINEVNLSYSNNPTVKYEPNVTDNTENTDSNTGLTPTDKVVVFTYEADVSKYNTAGTALDGAEFVLTRTNDGNTEYVQVDANNKVTGWTETEAEAKKFVSEASAASIKIKGLDDGTYTLIEKKAPEGYKLPEGDAAKFTFTIVASTAQSQTWTGAGESKIGASVLTGIDVSIQDGNTLITKDEGNPNAVITRNEETEEIESFTWKVENGAVGVAITNTSGTTLPGTGGIGTTIFYLGGGAMAAIGGIYLISKRRMRKSEE